ncbi:MAG TPA: response regulator [Anaerolineaceae bacterium]|jgi:CheY-like chemotaxis protein|nr:response regulator [Anaerolineaceae bacterium]
MNIPKKRTIIIVAEDDPDDRMLIQDAIEEADLTNAVEFVEDGASLMDDLHQRLKKTGQKKNYLPELILLDLNMPKKNGWQVLKEIKEDDRLKTIPVVILTTSSSPEDVQRSYQLGGNGFITKPSTFTGLIEIMKSLNAYWFNTVLLP